MARSLTVQHEETASTNPLLTAFLVIAALVLVLGAFASEAADAGTVGVENPAVQIPAIDEP